MMEVLIALAALAGNTVIAAATTDAWEACRGKVAQLLGRGESKKTSLAERWLTETQQQLVGAEGRELELARAALAQRWQGRFADLLDESPDLETELRVLVEEILAQLPRGVVSVADYAVAAGRDVNISASEGGVAAGVIHGSVTPANPSSPGSAAS